jgi:hypothetical protein
METFICMMALVIYILGLIAFFLVGLFTMGLLWCLVAGIVWCVVGFMLVVSLWDYFT